MIDRSISDVNFAIGNLYVSMHHFPEFCRAVSDECYDIARSYELFDRIADISNTIKHTVRHDPKRQVTVEATLEFLVHAPNSMSFLKTGIYADCLAWGRSNLSELAVSYANYLITHLGLNGGLIVADVPNPSEPKPTAEIRYTEHTFYGREFKVHFYKREQDGSLARDQGGPYRWTIIDECKSTRQVGRFATISPVPWTYSEGQIPEH